MKSITTLLATLLLFGLTATVPAQTIVRLTGAQAFGDALHRGIRNVLAGGGSYTYAYTGTDINKAQQTIWTGTVGGNAVIFKTSLNGSTAGIHILSNGSSLAFLANSTTQTVGGNSLPLTGNAAETAQAQGAVADSFQGSTIYNTTTLIDNLVGVGAYVFVVNNGAPAALNNITTQQAQALYAAGNLPLAIFTGQASDRTTLLPGTGEPAQVFATGRDGESGARLISFIETGIGATSYVTQYQPVVGSGGASGTIVNHSLYPASTFNGVYYPAGSHGNTSNGSLATLLTKTSLAGIGGYYISYLPTLDAATAVLGGARILAYNGAAYSPTAVQEGTYPLWAYEHLFYKDGLTLVQTSTLKALVSQLVTTDATVLLSTLKVSRQSDGGPITNDY